ncbi:MAG: LamB/YcsF family protein, partial [Muribaculaceae bacterium]|nr:LamB/YcsF family protein [Muribaculaceae bacterium]
IPLITSANVACGYHASDPVVMSKTVKLAKEAGIRVGAHPGVGLQVYVGEVATFHECAVTHRNAFSLNYYALQRFAVGKGVIANTFHGCW